jgi:hypothetical protein
MAEEYCWAITQAADGPTAADKVPVISSGLPWIYMMYSRFRLPQNVTVALNGGVSIQICGDL